MRSDALGFFWRDEPVVKQTKEVVKRTPPDPVWLAPDYLPGLEEALAFNVQVMGEAELLEAKARRDQFVFDIESYPNYWLAAFASLQTGAVFYVEMAQGYELDVAKLNWILTNFTTIGFNSIQYDMPITSLALAGRTPRQLKDATNLIIRDEWRPNDILRKEKVRSILTNIDHIDLIEVAPLFGSLKVYGGRLHAPRLQDLPFQDETVLSSEQMAIVRWYCVNDLLQTAILYDSLKEQIKLRVQLRNDYGIDVRSKSDAQIAEAVIAEEIKRRTGHRPSRPEIEPGTLYHYQVPHFMNFQTGFMQWALSVVASSKFVVGVHGSIEMPSELNAMLLTIGENTFKMGIGGLHSTESRMAHKSDELYQIYDFDVTSYYPAIILNLALYPKHLGHTFLEVYKRIVDKRLIAKRAGQLLDAESLKITVNGAFGKLGSKHSILYSPDLLTQVTLTGQLSLLMLIERFELAGFSVVSANTDGITVKALRAKAATLQAIVKQWETDTGFSVEETKYRAYYAKDVNNYIAVKDKGVKSKGLYSNPWGHLDDEKNLIMRLHKNPVNTVCLDAVEALLTTGIPIETTIRDCKDVCKFVSVRSVKGGAVKDGEYLGKTIRWYYTAEEGEIVSAKTGNKVPRSDGAKPLMTLPATLPLDLSLDWYIAEAQRILVAIGYAEPESS